MNKRGRPRGKSLPKAVGPLSKAVTSKQAATMLSIGESTMRKLIRQNKVHSFKIGRVYRITVKSIDDLIKSKEQQDAR